jgi:hypothetical protein
MKWTLLDSPPTKTAKYLVGHRGHQEIMFFFANDREWLPNTQMGWLRSTDRGWVADDPAKRFNARYYTEIITPKENPDDRYNEGTAQSPEASV